MISVCRQISTEYEALKTLKEKFVSACDEAKASAGSFDALSKQELRKLKLLKQLLEQARDTLEQHIENKAVETWKNIYEDVMTVTIEDGPFKGMSVHELIHQERFQKTFIRGIESLVNRAQTQLESARIAVIRFSAAVESKFLEEDTVLRIRELMDGQPLLKSKLMLCITRCVENGISNSDRASWAVAFLHATRELDLLSKEDVELLQLLVTQPAFRQTLVAGIEDNAQRGRMSDGNAWQATVGLHAALELDLLERNEKERIQEHIKDEDFQKKLVENIAYNVKAGQADRQNAVDVVYVINCIRGLIDLSRRRKRK